MDKNTNKLQDCKIEYRYPDITVTFEVEKVNFQPPYRYSKWLFTQMRDGFPFFSYQAKDDEELLILMAKQGIGATSINIFYTY